MSEFGHLHYTATLPAGDGPATKVHADGWGAGPFLITAGGKTFRFGDSDRFGPYLATRRGDPLANAWPAERSPFWRVHRIWERQGRRVADDGATCIWDEPKPEKVWRISKRSVLVIESGEPDGAMIEAAPEEVAAWQGQHADRAAGDRHE